MNFHKLKAQSDITVTQRASQSINTLLSTNHFVLPATELSKVCLFIIKDKPKNLCHYWQSWGMWQMLVSLHSKAARPFLGSHEARGNNSQQDSRFSSQVPTNASIWSFLWPFWCLLNPYRVNPQPLRDRSWCMCCLGSKMTLIILVSQSSGLCVVLSHNEQYKSGCPLQPI